MIEDTTKTRKTRGQFHTAIFMFALTYAGFMVQAVWFKNLLIVINCAVWGMLAATCWAAMRQAKRLHPISLSIQGDRVVRSSKNRPRSHHEGTSSD